MKFIALFLVSVISLSTFAHEDWNLKDLSLEKTLGAPFVKHEEGTPYLSFDLNYGPFKPYFDKVDQYSYSPLKNRGEAHITVITPPEFKDDLGKFMTIQEIDDIALKANIEKAKYTPKCLAKKGIFENDKYLETFFMVVESEDLLNIRKEIAKVYNSRGGKKFDPLHFYPHITLGFTDRDLHEADGVIKDAKTCLHTLHISPRKSNVPKLPISNSYYVAKNKTGGAVIRGNAPLGHKNLDIMKKFGISQFIIFKYDTGGEVKSEMTGLLNAGFNKEDVINIPFDWKDNQDFASGCKKFIQGIDLLKAALKSNKKLFFHCTTGEDRTGALAANYHLATEKNAKITTLFKKEMCEKGYEAGDTEKDWGVVEKIRAGLTQTFLKTAYRIDEAKKKKLPIDEKICEVDPTNDPDYIKYSTQMKFICGPETNPKKIEEKH